MQGQQVGSWAGYGSISGENGVLIWKPSREVAAHVPRQFELRLADLRGTQMRLIRPAAGFITAEANRRVSPGSFFYDARIGGLAVLIVRGLDHESRRMHDTAWFYIEKLLNTRTWLKRQFTGPLDFRGSAVSQGESEQSSILPIALNGRSMTVAELMRLGNDEADRQGLGKPTRREAVQLGLYASARESPLLFERLDGNKVRRMVRSALLDPERAPSNVTDDELQMVTERFADAVDPHLGDDLATFNRWFNGPKNTLVMQIAKRKTAVGGELDPARVTAALAELGWRSLLQGAKSLEAQMRCVAADLPEPLTGVDRARFEAFYSERRELDRLRKSPDIDDLIGQLQQAPKRWRGKPLYQWRTRDRDEE